MRTIAKGAYFVVILAPLAVCCVIFPPDIRSQDYYCFSGSDWTGNGQGNIAIWRPSTGLWSVLGVTRFYYGGGSGAGYDDIPVLWVSPFGSHLASPGIFRPALGVWHFKYDFTTGVYFGMWDDTPVPANYDGYLDDNIAIFRAGLWAVKSKTRFYFGKSGDIPVPGFWVYPPDATPAIFRSGIWAVKGVTRFYFGAPGDIPVPGSYVGISWQAAIFRPTTGLWAIRGVTRFYFGAYGDWPIAADLGRTTFQFHDGNDDPVIFRPSQGLWRIKGVFYHGDNKKWFGREGDIPVAGPVR